ncbi:SDR family NAD(P)-dependent oxidoreductase, partial [Escherichia coli]|uniref:SDR family NAD(P)-dependent oxidoreductase n=1 Tax=Escherichia coli TaxID=562 RepID=UPI0013027C5D
MTKTVLITGASSGFGATTARELADAGHVVYAGMRDVTGRNAGPAAEARAYRAAQDGGRVVPLEMDVTVQEDVDQAVGTVIDERGSIDVVVHNAGHMVLGPLEAFTVEQ